VSRTGPVAAVVAVSLVVVATALGSRPPTLAERDAIVATYPASLRSAPAECVWFEIRISTRDSRYASVTVAFNTHQKRCIRYEHNGSDILKKTSGRWKVYWTGSDVPSCKLKIPPDLMKCARA
jgi:hypothetical protein